MKEGSDNVAERLTDILSSLAGDGTDTIPITINPVMECIGDRELDGIIQQIILPLRVSKDTDILSSLLFESLLLDCSLEWDRRHPGMLPPCFASFKTALGRSITGALYEWPDEKN